MKAALVEEDEIIGESADVGQDVGGVEDGAFAGFEDFEEYVEQFGTHNGIEACGGFVEQEEFGLMG